MDSFKAPSIIPSRKKTPSAPTESQSQEAESESSSAGERAGESQVVSDGGEQRTVGETTTAEDTQSVKAVTEHEEKDVARDRKRETGSLSEGEPTIASNEEVMEGTDSSDENQKKISETPETILVSSGPPPPTPDLPYTEPHWSGRPSQGHSLTVIKSGSVLEEIALSAKPFLVFGRLPVCDVSLEHPSISRYHAVLQYRPTDAATTPTTDQDTGEGRPLSFGSPNEAGFYVYDLNSTHGSYLNKSKLQPRVYYRVRVGQMIRFGGSSRFFVLEVGSEGEGQEVVEAEAEAEIRELMRQKEEMAARQRRREEERERLAREREEMGATWGMVMEEVAKRENEDEEELTIDPEREAYYKDDPKKALKKYFDREGLELEYEVEEEGTGRDKTYIARVTLPIESGGGQLVVEESVRSRKKEAVVQCALKACRILDTNDMLRAASQRRQRVIKNWEENDYYDSDEDSFLDRTGELEQKRRQRMKRLGKLKDQAESYDSLVKRLGEVTQERQSIENRLSKSKSTRRDGGEGDSLEEFMSAVSSQLDPATITRLKRQALHLKKEEEMINKMLKVAKPAEMPALQLSSPSVGEGDDSQPSAPPSGSVSPGKIAGGGGSVSPGKIAGGGGSVSPGKIAGGGGPGKIAGGGGSVSPAGGGPSLSPGLSPTASAASDPATGPRSRSARRRRRRSSSSSSGPEVPGGGGGDQREASLKKPRVLGPALPQRDMPEQQKEVSETASSEFASWLPPKNQTGDGRTHLNDKYGY